MNENCDRNNANGPMPDHSCLFNHTQHCSGLITTGKDLLFNDLVCDTVQYVLRLGKMASKSKAHCSWFIHLTISGPQLEMKGYCFSHNRVSPTLVLKSLQHRL